MEEVLKDSTLTGNVRMRNFVEILRVPAKFNASFEFLMENVDNVLNV